MAGSKSKYALDILIGGKVDPSLRRAVSSAVKQLSGISPDKFGKVAKAAIGIGAGLKVAGAVGKVALNGITKSAELTATVLKKSVENAGQFEKQMANVSTLLSGTSEEVSKRVEALGDDVIQISNTTGVATEDLTDGLYQVISAFGDTEDAVKITELAAKSGAAGCATTTDAVNLLSAVTKAYGDTSYEANQKVSDMAFETVKLGQTTYPELASSIQNVTSLSKAMGVSQEEMFGVFAAGTGVIGDAAAVSTKLKAVYTKLSKPSKELSTAMSKLGYSSGEAMVKQLGLQGTLKKLTEYSKKTGVSLSQLYKSSEAAVLATALTGDLSDAWAEKTAAMSADALGQTDSAFQKQAATYEYTVQMLKNLGQNALTEIGQKLLPYLTDLGQKLLPKVTDAIDKFLPAIDKIFENVDWDEFEALLSDMFDMSVSLVQQILPQLVPILGNVLQTLNDMWPVISKIIDGLLWIIEAASAGFGILTGNFDAADRMTDRMLDQQREKTLAAMSPEQRASANAQVAERAAKAANATGTNHTPVVTTPPLTGNKPVYTFGVGGTPSGNAAAAATGSKTYTMTSSMGSLPTIPVTPQAEGGIITRPTLALIAEAGENEAVMPLSKLDAMLAERSNNTLHNETVSMTVTYAPVINVPSGDSEELREVMDDEFEKFKQFMEQYEREKDRVRF